MSTRFLSFVQTVTKLPFDTLTKIFAELKKDHSVIFGEVVHNFLRREAGLSYTTDCDVSFLTNNETFLDDEKFSIEFTDKEDLRMWDCGLKRWDLGFTDCPFILTLFETMDSNRDLRNAIKNVNDDLDIFEATFDGEEFYSPIPVTDNSFTLSLDFDLLTCSEYSDSIITASNYIREGYSFSLSTNGVCDDDDVCEIFSSCERYESNPCVGCIYKELACIYSITEERYHYIIGRSSNLSELSEMY